MGRGGGAAISRGGVFEAWMRLFRVAEEGPRFRVEEAFSEPEEAFVGRGEGAAISRGGVCRGLDAVFSESGEFFRGGTGVYWIIMAIFAVGARQWCRGLFISNCYGRIP